MASQLLERVQAAQQRCLLTGATVAFVCGVIIGLALGFAL